MSVRIVHLSDPHFGTTTPAVEEGLREELRRLQPALVVISGDITQRARQQQFMDASAFIKSLMPAPVIAVPGNHDIPLFNVAARVISPYAGFRRLKRGTLFKHFKLGGVELLGLASTSRWRHVQGGLNDARLARRLALLSPQAKVRIAMFHHPLDCAKAVDEKNLLVDRDETVKELTAARIDLVLGGHIHDPFVTLSRDRYPQAERTMILAVAGTCLSWRTRSGAPNSFNLVDIETDGQPKITIARCDIGEGHRFRPVEEHRFALTEPHGWQRL